MPASPGAGDAPRHCGIMPTTDPITHESRLTRELRALLQTQRVAALGTLCEDGAPLVSMVPFAIEAGQPCLVIHVSGLAAHTRNLQSSPRVSLMVMRAEAEGEPVHALPRVTLEGRAEVTPGLLVQVVIEADGEPWRNPVAEDRAAVATQ